MAAKKSTTSKSTSTRKSTAPKKAAKTTATGKATSKAGTSPKAAAQNSSSKSTSKKLSALDAAAKVLTEAKEPLNSRQLIDRMAERGYWTSPGGKTPQATLYAAIIREINSRGKEARFRKVDRGLFELNGDQ